MQVMTDGNN